MKNEFGEKVEKERSGGEGCGQPLKGARRAVGKGEWKGPVSPSGAQGPTGVDTQFGNESICFAVCDSFSPAGLESWNKSEKTGGPSFFICKMQVLQ